MNYIFKGNLRGFYCGDCYDYLYQAKVRIYAIDKGADVTALAVAREKETFHQRSDEELKSLSKDYYLRLKRTRQETLPLIFPMIKSITEVHLK